MLRFVVVVALIGLGAQVAHAFGRPMGMYIASPSGPGPALAMLDSRIEVTVRGPLVETVVTQRFRNPGDKPTEATYIFPLPADAAVSAMAIQIGTRRIKAAIEPRDAAQQRYEAAVAAGLAAALLDQERPDVFTQTVSAVPAHGTVEVTLRYDTVARYAAGTWQLVLPMVVAPRYVPGAASGHATTGAGRTPDTDRAPDASRVTPAAAPGAGGSTAIAIHFTDEPSELTSPSHQLGGTRRDATLSDPHSDHDAIVRWKAALPSAGWVEREQDGGGFAAIVVEAPVVVASHKPARVILAIDRAATTRGDGDVVAHPLVRALLDGLTRGDRVRVIGSIAMGWGSPDEARAVIERGWVARPQAFDLTRVLEAARPEGAAIVLISDGLVADDPAAIAAARRLGVAVHIVGVGPAPARATLTQIAAVSGGTARFAAPGDDLGALARATLDDVTSAPAALSVNWGSLAASDVEPAVLPRLGAGQAMLVLARIKHAQAANARVHGELFAFEGLAPAHPVDGAVTVRGPLARRWARERLGDLLIAGKPDRGAVQALAVAYGLVSPYTSLVAVGSDVVVEGGVKHSVAVPVSLPAGMQWHAVKQAIDRDTGVEGGVDTGVEGGEPARAIGERDDVPVTGKTVGRGAPVSTPAPITVAPPATAPPPAEPPEPPAKNAKGGSRSDSKPEVSDDKAAKKRAPAKRDADGDDDDESDKPARKREDERQHAAKPKPQKSVSSDDDDDRVRAPARNGVSVARGADAPGAAAADAPADEEHKSAAHDVAVVMPADATEQSEVSTQGAGVARGWRLTGALGGGLAFDHGTRSLLALDARLEFGAASKLGGEATLWLVGGSDAQGRALLTIARAGLAHWLELGLGAGVQFGDGTGVAASARLRIDTPISALAGFVRYDAGIVLSRPSVEVEHAVTLGLEISY